MMIDNSSLFKLVGLPDTFGVVLLSFSFILLLAPYFSGADFGLFKIPNFTESAKKWLKIIGPIAFGLCVLSFVPIIPKTNPTPSNSNINGQSQKSYDFWTREKSLGGEVTKAFRHSFSTLDECKRAEKEFEPERFRLEGYGCEDAKPSREELLNRCRKGDSTACSILEYLEGHSQ